MTTLLHAWLLAQAAATGGSPMPQSGWPPTYTLTEVTTPRAFVYATDLSEAGHVTGVGYTSSPFISGDGEAFVWRDGLATMLPTPPASDRVLTSAVDQAGRVYGSYRTTVDGTSVLLGVSWQAGALARLDAPFENVTVFPFVSPSGNWLAINSQAYDHGTPGWENEFGWVEEPDFTAGSGDAFLPWLQHQDGSGGQFRAVGTVAGATNASPLRRQRRGGGRRSCFLWRLEPNRGGPMESGARDGPARPRWPERKFGECDQCSRRDRRIHSNFG